jgi:N-acetylmuramoyl-L-alanine amidase
MRISSRRLPGGRAVLALVVLVCSLALNPLSIAAASDAVDLGSGPDAVFSTNVAESATTSGPLRVGLQAGHWKSAQLPASLARLRGNTGTAAAGRTEVALNLDLANRTAQLLRAQGIVVDILPATVPTGYRADAFVAIHADGNNSSRARGYKIASRWRSGVAFRDEVLVETLTQVYGDMTGLPRDSAVTRNMRGYYAFNTWLGDESRISQLTPAAIIETGYMTNPSDRAVLFNKPDVVAAGIARGILAFLSQTNGAAATIQARAEALAAVSPTQRSVVVTQDRVAVRGAASATSAVVTRMDRGDVLYYLDSTVRPRRPITNMHGGELAANSGYFRVGIPGRAGVFYINRDYVVVQEPAP